MFKYIFRTALLLVFFSLVGCQKDSEEFIPINNSTNVDANIFGIVVDDMNAPIEGASVVYRGEEILTDEFGIYTFKNVSVNSKHSFLNITKDGYFEGTRTFRTNHTKTLRLKTILLKKDFNQSFESSNGGLTTENVASLKFEPNSIMYADTKESYSGTVKVAMKYLDPALIETNQSMPGDLTSVNSQDIIGTLQSYGMVYVELQSSSGEKLQIQTGSTVEMSTIIPSVVAGTAPEEIPMWYFEDESGLWKEEGKAIRNGDSYIANVSHFSCWNYDYSLPSIVLSGRVVDPNGTPLSGVHVWISVVGEFLGGHGDTDSDGTFSGQSPKDLPLDFKVFIYGQDCSYSEPAFITQIGPFSSDTDLGDIVVDFGTEGYLTVTGTFETCDGDPVTNGFVEIGNHYIELTDGTLDETIIVCNNVPKFLVATDRDNLKSTEPVQLTSPGDHTLGLISVCDLEADFIDIECGSLNYNQTLLQQAVARNYIVDNRKSIEATFTAEQDSVLGTSVILYYYDDASDSFTEGTYDITTAFIYIYNYEDKPEFPKYFNQIQDAEITVTQGGTEGSKIIGTFSVTITEEGGAGSTCEFTGSFNLTY